MSRATLPSSAVYKSSLEDCFFASLAEVDPEQAQRLMSSEPSQAATLASTMLVSTQRGVLTWVRFQPLH